MLLLVTLRVCLILQIALFFGLVSFLDTISTIGLCQNGLIAPPFTYRQRFKEGVTSERLHTHKMSEATQSDANTNPSDKPVKKMS